jgi:hypothetical protein
VRLESVRHAAALSIEPTVLTRLLKQHYLPDGWVARVTERKGEIIARSARFVEPVGKPALADYVGVGCWLAHPIAGAANVAAALGRASTVPHALMGWASTAGERHAPMLPRRMSRRCPAG